MKLSILSKKPVFVSITLISILSIYLFFVEQRKSTPKTLYHDYAALQKMSIIEIQNELVESIANDFPFLQTQCDHLLYHHHLHKHAPEEANRYAQRILERTRDLLSQEAILFAESSCLVNTQNWQRVKEQDLVDTANTLSNAYRLLRRCTLALYTSDRVDFETSWTNLQKSPAFPQLNAIFAQSHIDLLTFIPYLQKKSVC